MGKSKSSFPLEKILTISAREWYDMYGKKLDDYEAKGIHYEVYDMEFNKQLSKEFASQVPNNAEVVVAYKFFTNPNGGNISSRIVPRDYASGTALIPKK